MTQTISNDLLRCYRFFRKQVGSAAYALGLAKAECWRENEGDCIRVRWLWDETPWEAMHDDEPPPEEWLGCILETRSEGAMEECHHSDVDDCDCKHWRHDASLWGIADPDRNYRRVVEAELCLEIMP